MKKARGALRLLVVLALLFTLCASARADGKTLTVGEGQDYPTIQKAIDAIANDPTGGHTIEIQSGTYDRFYVPPAYEHLTITAAQGANVIVKVLDGRTSDKEQREIYGANIESSECGAQCALIRGSDITVSGITFQSMGEKKLWLDAAIGVYTGGAVKIDRCVFKGVDHIGYGIFAQNGVSSLTVTHCEFDTLDQAIFGENTKSWFVATEISNNTFKNCSFALHWSYNSSNILTDGDEPKKVDADKKAKYNTDGNYFKLINNTIVGAETLRNKVVLQDSYDADMCTVTISGNKLTYGLIGLVNIADTKGNGYQLASNLLQDNTYGNSSFVVEASLDYAAGMKEKVAVYKADSEAYGKWVIHDNAGIKEKDFYPLIEQAVAAANQAHSNELQITGLKGYEEVLYTFTWYKDAIYWVTEAAPTPTPTPTPTPVPTPTATAAIASPPKTGDDMPLMGAALCALFSAAAIWLLLSRKRT